MSKQKLALFLMAASFAIPSCYAADCFSSKYGQGNDAGVRISACLSTLPQGGVADATGFQGTWNWGSTVNIKKNNVRLVFGQVQFIYSAVAITVNADSVEISGVGDATDFQQANYTGASWIEIATNGAANSGLTIHDMQNDGNGIHQRAIDGFGIQADTPGGSVTNFHFYNLYLHDGARNRGGNEIQIGAYGSGPGLINGVRCENHSCIVVLGNSITVSNNICTNSDDDCFGAVGRQFIPVAQITIIGNICNGTTAGSCVDLLNAHNSSVTGNVLTQPYLDCILVFDGGAGAAAFSTDISISGNSCSAPGRNGVTITGLRTAINGNTVRGAANSGIYVSDGSDYVSVSGNTTMDTVGGNDAGLTVSNSTNVELSGNTSGNDQVPGTQAHGLYVAGSSSGQVYVTGNTFFNNLAAPYLFAGGSGFYVSGNCFSQSC